MEKLCRNQSRGKNPAMVANDPDLKKFQYIFNLIYRPDQVKMLEHDKAIFGEQGISSYSSRIKKGFHKQNYYGFHKQNYRNCTQFYIEGKFIVKSSYKNSCEIKNVLSDSRRAKSDIDHITCAIDCCNSLTGVCNLQMLSGGRHANTFPGHPSLGCTWPQKP